MSTTSDKQTVSFTQMDQGTKEDYELLGRRGDEMLAKLPDRLLEAVEALEHSIDGYQVTRKEHSLQSATRALQDDRSEEYVVAALLHDIGDVLAPHTHGEMVDAVLRPYVAADICWLVKHHGAFQMYYYAHLSGQGDRYARERYRDHPNYQACIEFCEKYDQNCFDPEFEALPLSYFEPMVRRVFSEPRYLDRV
jgi:predicted HD phosphohydrolase